MKKLFLLSLIFLCGCALVSTNDHTETFEKFDKKFPNKSSELKAKPNRSRF